MDVGGGSSSSPVGLHSGVVHGLHVQRLPPFLTKTFEMVDDPTTDSIVSWSTTRNSFIVRDMCKFTKKLLPKHFSHDNFSSFVRQLNAYGFKKVDSKQWEFANDMFLGGRKDMLKNIKRKRNAFQTMQPSELGQYLHTLESETLKLRHEQQVLHERLVRVEENERKQQHIIDFLGRAFFQELHGCKIDKQRLSTCHSNDKLQEGLGANTTASEEVTNVESEREILFSTSTGNEQDAQHLQVSGTSDLESGSSSIRKIWEELVRADLIVSNEKELVENESQAEVEGPVQNFPSLEEYEDAYLKQMGA